MAALGSPYDELRHLRRTCHSPTGAASCSPLPLMLLVRLITRIINDLIAVTVLAMRRHSPTRPLDAAGMPETRPAAI